MIARIALLCLAAFAACSGQHFPRANIDVQARAPLFFSFVTVTVSTTTPTTTSTATCWTTTATPTTPCTDIRRRSIADNYDSDNNEENDEPVRQERQANLDYGYLYPQSTFSNVDLPAPRSSSHLVQATMNRFLISLVTATANTVTVVGTSKVTTTITCAYPSKILAC